MFKFLLTMIRRYFIAGLLLWLPIWATLLVLHFLINLMDGVFSLLPERYQPQHLLGFDLPGLGLIISILVILFTGMLITNFLGRRLVAMWEAMLSRIPFVRSIYSGVKQVVQTIVAPGGSSFRKVLLIEYPRQGVWTIAFQGGDSSTEISHRVKEELITVYVPTTPNPTSGFLLMLPRRDVIELNMTVEQALKYVISLGVMQPEAKLQRLLRKESEIV